MTSRRHGVQLTPHDEGYSNGPILEWIPMQQRGLTGEPGAYRLGSVADWIVVAGASKGNAYRKNDAKTLSCCSLTRQSATTHSTPLIQLL
jgi:hypothetical protein